MKRLATQTSCSAAALLWSCIALFAARVLGQFEVLLVSPDWLPGMEAWYSGLLPYYLLLPVQIAILMRLYSGRPARDIVAANGDRIFRHHADGALDGDFRPNPQSRRGSHDCRCDLRLKEHLRSCRLSSRVASLSLRFIVFPFSILEFVLRKSQRFRCESDSECAFIGTGREQEGKFQ
jgi:hypothetical protein